MQNGLLTVRRACVIHKRAIIIAASFTPDWQRLLKKTISAWKDYFIRQLKDDYAYGFEVISAWDYICMNSLFTFDHITMNKSILLMLHESQLAAQTKSAQNQVGP